MKLSPRTSLFVAIAAVTVVATAVIGIAGRVGRTLWWTDGASIHERVGVAPLRHVLWKPAEPLAGAGGARVDEYEPKLSADGTLMVFVRRRAGTNADLFTSRWSPAGWSEPVPLDAINTEHDELGPELSQDGKSLYFYSDRPGGFGGFDIWVSRASEGGWGAPINLGPAVNTSWNEYGPALAPDGRTLYFSSNRPREGEGARPPQAWPATMREQHGRHDYDLYACEMNDGEAAPAVSLGVLNTEADEGTPAVSPAGDFLYFASDRGGGLGGFDIYRSRIARGSLGPPENLGAAVNSVANDLDPALSADGFRLYFSSDRPASVVTSTTGVLSDASAAAERRYGLWSTASREVFQDIETQPRGPALAQAWHLVWPWLLLLTAMLALIWLLASFLGNDAWRRRLGQLSLLARCLLISLLIHVALASGLAVWKVGTGIIDAVRRAGGTRVILVSSGGASDVDTQIRAVVSGVATPLPALETLPATVNSPPITSERVRALAAPLTRLDTSRVSPDVGEREAPNLVAVASITPPSAIDLWQASVPRLATHEGPAQEPAATTDVVNTRTPPASISMAAIAQEVQGIAPPTSSHEHDSAHPLSILPGDSRGGAVSVSATSSVPADHAPSNSHSALPTLASPAAAPSEVGAAIMAAKLDSTAAAPPRISGPTATEIAAVRPPVNAHLDARPVSADVEASARGSSLSMDSKSSGTLAAPNRVAEGGTAQIPRVTVASEPEPVATLQDVAPHVSATALLTVGAPDPIQAVAAPGAPAMELAPGEKPSLGVGVQERVPTPAIGPALSAPQQRVGSAVEGRTPTLPDAASTPAEPALAAVGGAGLSHSQVRPADVRTPGAMTVGAIAVEPPRPSPASSSGARPSVLAVSADPSETSGRPTVTSPSPAAAPSRAATSDLSLRIPEVPSEPVQPVETFAQRAPEVREEVLEKMGGSADTERAVGLALEWFARHQETDGRWTGRHFDDRCGHCDGAAEFDADAAMTGMALLCYLGAGHTHEAEGPYRDVVAKALHWLVNRQGPNGDLRRGETMYGQTVSTVALCEALAMTKDQSLAVPTRRAVAYVVAAATTRDRRVSDQDTSVLGWLVMTVESARRAGIEVPREIFDAAGKWLDQAGSTRAPGRYSYRRGDAPSPAMTAEAMFVRQLLGHARTERMMEESAQFILETPPRWTDGAPTYHWYYATLALFDHQGAAWKEWNEAMVPALVEHQRRDGAAAGSWDPQDRWSRMGGRIYQTAVCTLSLEVYYRYKPR